ncbi:MAG: YbeD family protein [Steroidobacteraceae bacterium]
MKHGDGAAPPPSAADGSVPRSDEDTLFQFPTDFPVKIMGHASDDFRSLVLGIVTRHFGALEPHRIEERASANGNYLSLTCTVYAHSKAELDALYRELTSCSQVLVAL